MIAAAVRPRRRHWLACILACWPAGPAAAQLSIEGGVAPPLHFGRIATGIAPTTIILEPDGNRIVGGGGGAAIGGGHTPATFTVRCEDNLLCGVLDLFVRVATVGVDTAGRLRLVEYRVGQTSRPPIGGAPDPGTIVNARFSPVGFNGSVSFQVGAIAEMLPTGNTGLQQISYRVTARLGSPAANTGGIVRTASAIINRGLAAAVQRNLVFGRVAVPPVGVTLVSVGADGTLSPAAAFLPGSPARTPARFFISGESGQAISISVPPAVTLRQQDGNGLLAMTTAIATALPQTLSGAANDIGTAAIDVGGTVELPSTTAAGLYTGTLAITAAYN
jgi:hypothetical protein